MVHRDGCFGERFPGVSWEVDWAGFTVCNPACAVFMCAIVAEPLRIAKLTNNLVYCRTILGPVAYVGADARRPMLLPVFICQRVYMSTHLCHDKYAKDMSM